MKLKRLLHSFPDITVPPVQCIRNGFKYLRIDIINMFEILLNNPYTLAAETWLMRCNDKIAPAQS